MFFLVTGASGSGKSTARRLAEPQLSPDVVCAELFEIVDIPAEPDHAWRQQATEAAVQYALDLQNRDQHLLLSGDPVAIGEVLAAPSADKLNGIAGCLLDVDDESQRSRLLARGDDPTLFVNHHGFSEWMRGHVRDPQHRQFVIVEDGWGKMEWQRWTGWSTGDPRWQFHVIDTSTSAPATVARQLTQWIKDVLSGDAPALRGTWWR